MDREGFFEGVALVEIDVEVASNEVVRQFGVQSTRNEVVVALRMERYEH